MKDLLRNWDIGNVTAIEPISSYGGKATHLRTVDGRDFILKEKPDLVKAEQESNLLFNLSKAGAPVAVPVATVDGDWCALDNGRIFCLYPRLPGEVIREHYAGNAVGRAEMFGKAIGLLHACLLKCESLEDYLELHLLKQMREWALPCVHTHKGSVDGDSLERAWLKVERKLEPLYDRLPKQLIHRDAHPANMLFDGDKLVGFIDFELVVRGPRIFDVCYCGTSLLVSGFPQAEKMQAWPGLFHSLLKGYQEINPLTSAEVKALFGILTAIELLFVAFSLENGAESAARCNESLLHWLSANRELLGI